MLVVAVVPRHRIVVIVVDIRTGLVIVVQREIRMIGLDAIVQNRNDDTLAGIALLPGRTEIHVITILSAAVQVPLFLEERVREQVLKWHAPISLAMEQGGLSRTRTKTAEEGLIIGERIGRGAEVALLALLLMLLLEPVHPRFIPERFVMWFARGEGSLVQSLVREEVIILQSADLSMIVELVLLGDLIGSLRSAGHVNGELIRVDLHWSRPRSRFGSRTSQQRAHEQQRHSEDHVVDDESCDYPG